MGCWEGGPGGGEASGRWQGRGGCSFLPTTTPAHPPDPMRAHRCCSRLEDEAFMKLTMDKKSKKGDWVAYVQARAEAVGAPRC